MKAWTWPLLAAIATLAALGAAADAQTTPSPPPSPSPSPVPSQSPSEPPSQPPSPEQARILEQQVRAWLAQMTGGALTLPDDVVRFTPDATGYVITAPIGDLAAVEPKDAALIAHAHPLDGTRWAIDSEQLPPALKITTQQRFPDDPDAPPPNPLVPGVQSGTHLETVTYEVKIGQQAVSGVFDPSYATASSVQSTIASIDLVQTGGPAAMISHIGASDSVSSTTPSSGGLIDLLVDGTMQNYQTKTAFTGGGPSITLTMERVHVLSSLSGFAHAKLPPLIGLAVSTARLAQAAEPAALEAVPPPPKPATRPGAAKPGVTRPGVTKPGVAKPGAAKPGVTQPEAAKRDGDLVQKRSDPSAGSVDAATEARLRSNLRAMLVAASGLLTGGKIDESLDGLVFDVSGTTGAVSHAAITFEGEAPQDMLNASFGFTLDGLTIPSLPPALAGYVPSHFVIHPTVSNLSVAALTKLGMDASAPGAAGPPDADFAALFEHGGINFGFDQLGLDIADTQFTGTGSFNLAGPQTVTGQAEISARGLDALIAKAQADPMLVQAVPVIIFLKGVAKTNADQAVWQISLANGRTLVNGVDLSAIAGGMGR